MVIEINKDIDRYQEFNLLWCDTNAPEVIQPA